jgi:5-formyltetrahydrofolate cyclo-ligase
VTDRADHPASRGADSIARALAAAKHAARVQARTARESLDRDVAARASADASLLLVRLPELANAALVLAYVALPAEIDPLPAVIALRHRGIKIAYPRIASPGVLGVHIVDDEADLVPGPFGLAQPDEVAPQAALNLIDAAIVPAVAFDERGMRLGYGGGYYDRLLPLLRPDCLRVGLAFDEQILAEIPAEAHDVAVDLIVTQTRALHPMDQRTP